MEKNMNEISKKMQALAGIKESDKKFLNNSETREIFLSFHHEMWKDKRTGILFVYDNVSSSLRIYSSPPSISTLSSPMSVAGVSLTMSFRVTVLTI
jgi:hypothetical protein